MKTSVSVLVAAVLVGLACLGLAGEMSVDVKMAGTDRKTRRIKFANYPGSFRHHQIINSDAAGLRFILPGRVPDIPQSGVYSLEGLAGDCEVIVTFELLDLEQPRTGYGAGFGLAFDVENSKDTWGSIQRVFKVHEGNGFVVLTNNLLGPNKQLQDDYKFVNATSKKGQMGLRRTEKELTFLAVDSPTDELQVIKTVPFPDRPIRPYRLFVDNGGSPTRVDVRVTQIAIRAEEKTANVAQIQSSDKGGWWLWITIPAVAVVGAAAWFWWTRRRKAPDDEDAEAPVKKR
jgi:hypothetical protein